MPGERKGIRREMAVQLKNVAIIAVEAIFGGEPHESEAILKDVMYHTLRQPILNGQFIELNGLCILGCQASQQQE